MRMTIERLVMLGYDEKEAEAIYREYEKDKNLCSLYGYLEAKESIERRIEE